MTNVWRERAQQILEIAGVATVKVLADDRDVWLRCLSSLPLNVRNATLTPDFELDDMRVGFQTPEMMSVQFFIWTCSRNRALQQAAEPQGATWLRSDISRSRHTRRRHNAVRWSQIQYLRSRGCAEAEGRRSAARPLAPNTPRMLWYFSMYQRFSLCLC